ncbi:hypothetical protein [Novosphingobium album (ex Liu et al. 2023)]|uniref:Uncharacterized protein n=1 Tax=Novosphingobium album (ex Liu et al. 2023) TaxID=3031130 RepID=A0ABT5WXZ8_9SPHN|nr:hypothetical protein [Novosphingobium album (ex Liu et al. 2023)]MDE8654791.1 hypothetical protein [Novosphingobium album (ex Liu et al. 2023)]
MAGTISATREIARRRETARKNWAARHPDKARQERELRRHNREVRDGFGHKVHGTPETCAKAARTRQGALARLYQAGDISIDQLAAAADIAAVHAKVTRDVAIGTVSLETRVDACRRNDALFFERLGAVRAEVAYSNWRRALPEPLPVLAMVIDDVSCSTAASHFGMHKRRAKAILTQALDDWFDRLDQACREIDDVSVTIAHLRIR